MACASSRKSSSRAAAWRVRRRAHAPCDRTPTHAVPCHAAPRRVELPVWLRHPQLDEHVAADHPRRRGKQDAPRIAAQVRRALGRPGGLLPAFALRPGPCAHPALAVAARTGAHAPRLPLPPISSHYLPRAPHALRTRAVQRQRDDRDGLLRRRAAGVQDGAARLLRPVSARSAEAALAMAGSGLRSSRARVSPEAQATTALILGGAGRCERVLRRLDTRLGRCASVWSTPSLIANSRSDASTSKAAAARRDDTDTHACGQHGHGHLDLTASQSHRSACSG